MDIGIYKASVIIPNYNRRNDLERLLPSIADQTATDYEVVIIDDSSPDGSAVEYIRAFVKDHRNMRLVENTKNMGFVKTCNKGIRLANSDYICVLTNDTETARNFIQRNLEIMDADSSIGVLSCIIVDRNGNNWFSGGCLNGGKPSWLTDDFEGIRSVDYVAGTACFYRKEVFDKVGLLNEQLVMYHEDVEFCIRVHRLTNYRSCMFGEKLVTHNVAVADLVPYPQAIYYTHRNLILIARKYFVRSMPKILWSYVREVANLLLVTVLKRDKRYFLYIPHIIRGTLNGIVEKVK
jgi:GT2 family glycosyltransferase